MKYLNVLTLFLALFYFSIAKIHGQGVKNGVPFSTYFSSQIYGGGIQNWNITQKSNGLLYVANNFGLLEYDGTSWNRFTIPGETKVRDVAISKQGKIYIASQGNFGYFFINEFGQYEFTSLSDQLTDEYKAFDETWRVFLNDESVLFCTFKHLFRFDFNDSLISVLSPENNPTNFYQINKRLFVNLQNEGLTELNNNTLQLLPDGEIFKNQGISGILPLANNKLCIVTPNNGVFLQNEDLTIKPWLQDYQTDFVNGAINTAIRLRNGTLAFGTQNEGLYLFNPDGTLQMHLNKETGLNNRTILCLFEDIQGNLWVGHNNGISCVQLSLPFSFLNEETGLPGTGYDAYLFQNKLYVATNNGVFYKPLEENAPFQFVENTKGQAYKLTSFGNTLLLGHHHGAFQINNNSATSISPVQGAWTFLQLKYPNQNYYLGGTYTGLTLYTKSEDGNFEFVRKIKGFNESSRVMELDENGTIWMAHGYKGVYRLTLNDALDSVKVEFYNENNGLPSHFLINVWRVQNQLIFTTEYGIYQFNASTNRFEQSKLFGDQLDQNIRITSLAEDPLGNIYYVAFNEAGMLQKQAPGGYKKYTRIFNSIKELLNDDLQNISVLKANEILFAAKEGFILYNTNQPNNIDANYNVLIRDVSITALTDSTISNGNYLETNSLTDNQPDASIPLLNYSENSLHFKFSAPFFDPQNRTTYKYWLENAEKTWSTYSSKNDKEYTNLREGTYTFHVQAKNILGQESAITSYSFVILPPWYRTNIAFAVYITLLLSVLIGVFYFSDKRYRKKTEELEEKQEQEIIRFDTVIKTTEAELERVKREKLESEINSKNKELANSTMHLLNKNDFISGVKSTLVGIIKRSSNPEVRKEIKKVVDNIERNIAQDNDWDDFAIHFDQVHGDFSTRLKEAFPNLSPQEMKLSAYLRMNLSTKEIAQLLNISIRGVEIARYRLRKKLELDREVNLQQFILNF